MDRSRLATYVGLTWVLLTAACIPALPHGKMRDPSSVVPPSYGGRTDTTNSAQLKRGEFFTDPKLNALIDLALQNNQEINIVSAEVDIAKNEIMARQGEYLPKVGFGVGGGVDKVGRYTSQGASDDATGLPQILPNLAFGFSATWELDIWSKLRNATKAATLRYLASQEGRNFAVTRLVGEIANSYYELVALDAQLDVLQQNIEIQKNALAVIKLQKEAAKVTELAVKRFQAEVLKNQSRQYTIQQQIVETENRLNFLCGRFPQHADRTSQRFVDLVPPIVHTGIPAQLLENRPDVKEAQLDLVAANLDIKVAKAGFYPSIGLSANIGYQSFDLSKIFATPWSIAFSLAGDLVAPLLNRKAITATYYTANAKQTQAVYNFERAVLKGYIEVIKLLTMIHNLEQSYDLQSQQVEKLTQSIDISSKLFASARADYMEVLLTRRDALEAQMELIENKQRQMSAAVGLYQALGGGWR